MRECANVSKENKYAIKKLNNFRCPPAIFAPEPPGRHSSALLNAGVSVVIMDAFVVFRLHFIPGNLGVGVQF